MNATLPISHSTSLPSVDIPVSFEPRKGKLAMVLNRATGYFLIDGQTLRTVSYSTTPGKVFECAHFKGFVLVNETSKRGLDIIQRMRQAKT